jgi:hypothetical protein
VVTGAGRCLCALFVGVLFVTGPAAAQIRPSAFPYEPAFAGDRVLWFERLADGAATVEEGPVAGPPRTVQRFPEHGGADVLDLALAASPQRAVVSVNAYEDVGPRFGLRPLYVDVFTGPSAGPLERIFRCPGDEVRLRSVDVSGDAYVYRQCDDHAGHVEVRDPGEPSLSPSRSVGFGGYGARIAGRYVAWLDGYYSEAVTTNAADVVVYDRVLDSELYRIPRSEIPGLIHSLDVQDDGKVAFAFDPSGDYERGVWVAWASPAEPRVHLLPLGPRHEYDVKIANDRIAFQRGNGPNWAIQDAEVGIAELSGRTRILGRGSDDMARRESFDFDGRRLVWIELGCEDRTIVVHDIDAASRENPRGRCRLRLLSRPRLRGRVLRLRVGCGALPGPCWFAVSLRTTGPGRRRYVGYGGGDSDGVRVSLTRAGQRLLARRGSLRLRVEARFGNNTHADSRHTTIVVRRP